MPCQSFNNAYVFDTIFLFIWDDIDLPLFERLVHKKYRHSYPKRIASKMLERLASHGWEMNMCT